MKHAVLRFDASAEVGLGHAMRMRAIAEALGQDGVQCRFAINQDAPSLVPWAADRAILVEGLADQQADILARSVPGDIDFLVIDHYGLGERFETACRNWCGRIMVLDDLADRAHDCDVLIDPAPRSVDDYGPHLGVNTRCLVGPAYAPIRSSFASWRTWSLTRDRSGDVRRIAVMFGGTDLKGLTGLALESIWRCQPSAYVDVFIGNVSKAGQTRAMMAHLGLAGDVNVGIDDPSEKLAHADLVIGSTGVSAWERCILGLPSVAVQTSANQALNARALVDADAALVLPLDRAKSTDGLVNALRSLTEDAKKRESMGRAAAAMCDGRGAERASVALSPFTNAKGAPVTLRPATFNDTEKILEWQRIPGIRRHFRNPSPPTEEDHQAFMSQRLASLDGGLMIIENDGMDAGMLRLDPIDDGRALEVSILVIPSAQGAGVGKAALTTARRIWHNVDLEAEISPNNLSSREAFLRAGYIPCGDRYRNPGRSTADVEHLAKQ
jgi:UDP-2,4-diacetamido-2,4,6-trideoxy-beta-L-altropyranose hydrolase